MLFVWDDWEIFRDGPEPIFAISNFSVEYTLVNNCVVSPFTIKLELTTKSPFIVALPLYKLRLTEILLLLSIAILLPKGIVSTGTLPIKLL